MRKPLLILVAIAAVFLGACTTDGSITSTDNNASYDDTSYTDDNDSFDAESPEMQRLALDMTWDQMDYDEQADICNGVDMFGVDTAVDLILKGADDGGADYTFDRSIVADWLTDNC